MKPWNTVAIIGVGMIGGSAGLALRRRKLANRVIGIGRRAESLRKAEEIGAVTATTLRPSEGVAEADLVVVATPVADIVRMVLEVAPSCRPGTLITDAGSTKSTIVAELDGRLPAAVRFVGSHPLAGSEKSGPESSCAELFEGRIVVVTPSRKTRTEDSEAVGDFWSALGATVFMMSPEAHDLSVASTSHLPHLLAALTALATPKPDRPLTASGWRDITRVAGGDPELWTQILLDNRANVLKSLARFETTLARARTALERGDRKALTRILTEAKQIRDVVGS